MKVEVEKEKLEELTEHSIVSAMQSLALLASTGCPIPDPYAQSEETVTMAENFRREIGVEPLLNDEILKACSEGEISKKITAKLTSKLQAAVDKLKAGGSLELGKKPAIGFQIPEIDKNKMN